MKKVSVVTAVLAMLCMGGIAQADIINVAESGAATQSSTYTWDCYNAYGNYCGTFSLPASLAIDGVISNPNPNFPGGGSASGTTAEVAPWWQVTFDAEYPISSIVLHGCTYGCRGELNPFSVSLYDGNGILAWSSDGVGVADQVTFEVNNVAARTLRVELSGQSERVLELREVQAFTGCLNPPSGLVSWWGGDNNALDMIGTNHGTFQGNASYTAGKVGQAFRIDSAYWWNTGLHQNCFPESADYCGTWDPSYNPDPLNYKYAHVGGGCWRYHPATGLYGCRSDWFEWWEWQEGGYVEIQGTFADFGGNPFTVDFWMYSNNSGNGAYLMGKSHPDGGLGWDIRLHENKIRLEGTDGWDPNFNWESDASVTPNSWHHIAISSTESQLSVYIDGVLKGTPSRSAISSTTNPFRIGFTTNYGGTHFSGLIDEVEIFNRALSAEEIAAIYNAGSAGKCRSCATVPPDLVSWWKAEDNADDTIGTSNGTPQGGATYAGGRVGRAFSFASATNDGVVVPSSASLNPTDAISMSAWIKPIALSNPWPYIIGKRTDAGEIQYAITISDRNTFHCDLNGGGAAGEGGVIPLNEWSYVACTYDRNTLRLFVNGAQVASAPGTFAIPTGSAPLTIGMLNGYTTRNFDGLIDEVEIFGRALSAEEIGAIYNAGSVGHCDPDRTPRPFSFAVQSGVEPNAATTSNTITVEEVVYPSPISITTCTSSLCEYRINDGEYTSTDGTVNNDDTVVVRQTSSPNFFATTGLTLTIGGVSGTFTVTTRAQSADLSITKTSAPTAPVVGQPLTYTLTVTNTGPDEAEGVTVTDVLAASLAFDSATGCTYNSGNRTVTCDLGSVGVGTGNQKSVEIIVIPTVPGPVSNAASVSTTVSDPNSSNNLSPTDQTTVFAQLYLPLILRN